MPAGRRTAEIACTISEMHALSPKLAGKRCNSSPMLGRNRSPHRSRCYDADA